MATNPPSLDYPPADLHPELQKYMVTYEFLGECIKHPLVMAVPYFPAQAGLLNDWFKQKTEQLQQAVNEKNWDSYIWLHERYCRFDALYDLECEIPDEEFWRLFGDVYTDSENVGQNYDVIAGWLDQSVITPSIMTDEEQEILRLLPDTVTIYRGYEQKEEIDAPTDWSWTLSPSIAEWFANRFDRGGYVVRGTIAKDKIMAVFNRRGEDEVLVWGHEVTNQSTLKPEEVPT